MLIRREYAPARSPTSFSYGGGVWKGFASNILSNSTAFGFSPAASNFFASRCACRVNTSVHFATEAPVSICQLESSAHELSKHASPVSRANTGSLVSLANHQQRSTHLYSFSKQCGLARGISRTPPAVLRASLFQRSQFSYGHSRDSSNQDTRLSADSQFALPPSG